MSANRRAETRRKPKPRETCKVGKKETQSIPSASELATLAAILAPDGQPSSAVRKAMEFYIEAMFFLRNNSELPTNFEILVREFGNEEQRERVLSRLWDQETQAQWADVLELDPEKHDDEVRRFLAEHGYRVKWARTVLDNLRGNYKSVAQANAGHVRGKPLDPASIFEESNPENSKKTYFIPRFILEDMANRVKHRRAETKHKAWETRQKARVKTRQSKSHA